MGLGRFWKGGGCTKAVEGAGAVACARDGAAALPFMEQGVGFQGATPQVQTPAALRAWRTALRTVLRGLVLEALSGAAGGCTLSARRRAVP